MKNDYHETIKKADFKARLSGFIHNRHTAHRAKRVAQDIYTATGQTVPTATIYKWIDGDTFPGPERLAALMVTYPRLAAALYGDFFTRATAARRQQLKALVALAEAELGAFE